AYYTLSAFQYLPRQDGSACGWIHQYEFYVSSDGVYWNTPVAAGNFDYTGYAAQCPGPGAGVPTPRQIGFPVTIARYIRLRALSEVNGNPWTSAAEIDALGDLLPGLFPSAGGLDFPDQLLNTSSAPLPLVLTNVGLSAVGITGIGAFGDFIQTNNCATSLPALASCTINVTFTPTVLGYRSARLTVLNSATGQLEIPLSGNGVMPIMSLSSASAVFGPQLLNTTGRAPSIFVSNGGSGPLLVSNVTVAGDFGQANDCAVGVDVSAGCTLQVFFTPTALGTHSGTITIFDNTAAGSHSISMSGVGVAMHNLNLSWTASTSPVIGYFVYRATQSGGPYTELNPVPQPQTTFIDSLPGGATYYYVVTAVNASLVESVTTPEVAATIPQP
ncbi:MAG: choice-of-anchor D domain-containing protein, partial [Terriglobales bacterium]